MKITVPPMLCWAGQLVSWVSFDQVSKGGSEPFIEDFGNSSKEHFGYFWIWGNYPGFSEFRKIQAGNWFVCKYCVGLEGCA